MRSSTQRRKGAKAQEETLRVAVQHEMLIERLLDQKRYLTEQALEHRLKYQAEAKENRLDSGLRNFEFASWLAKIDAAAAIAVNLEIATWCFEGEIARSRIEDARKTPNCLDYFLEHYPTYNFDGVQKEVAA